MIKLQITSFKTSVFESIVMNDHKKYTPAVKTKQSQQTLKKNKKNTNFR